jgi:hypothetical protein
MRINVSQETTMDYLQNNSCVIGNMKVKES